MQLYVLVFLSIAAFLILADFAFNQEYIACLGWFLIWCYINIKAIIAGEEKERLKDGTHPRL